MKEKILQLTREGGCPSEGEVAGGRRVWASAAAMALGGGFAAASRHDSCSRGPEHATWHTGLARCARSGDAAGRRPARPSQRRPRTSQCAPPPKPLPALHAVSSPQPRPNLFARRAGGRGPTRQREDAQFCGHTGSSLRTLPDRAAAVRGPKSVLIHVLFGQTLWTPGFTGRHPRRAQVILKTFRVPRKG